MMEPMEKAFYDDILLNFEINNSKKDKDYLIEFVLEDKSIKFETEKITSKSENSLLEFSKKLLCPYYFYKIQNINLRVKRWKDRVHYIYLKIDDKIHLTLSTIINAKNMAHEIKINEKDEDSEIIIIKAEKPINKSNNVINNSLLNYLTAGVSFESYIGIDFSDKMLHNVDIAKNQYINAIRGFRETLFDFQRNFEVYGFGTNLLDYKIDKDNSFFNLSLRENPNLLGLTNIKQAYTECLKKIDFGRNNNYLSPLLNHIQKRIYEKNNLTNYNILFLLINKCPKKDDIQSTIDALIQSSCLPLSIVIIGIGDNENEFNNIKNLYINNNISSKGIKKVNNNIFFISMKECNYDDSILKDKCLKEIPKQLSTFYELANISIKDIKEKNINKISQISKNLINQNNVNQNKNNTNIIDFTEDSNPAPPLVNNIIEEKAVFVSQNYLYDDFKIENNNHKNINISNNINLEKSNNIEKDKMANNNNDKNIKGEINNKNNENNNDKGEINNNNNSKNTRKSLPEKEILNYKNKNNINNNLNINNSKSNNINPEQKSKNDGKIGIKNIFNPDCSIFRSATRKKTHDNRQRSMESLQNKLINLPKKNNNNSNLLKSNIIKNNEIKNNVVKDKNNKNINEEKNNNNIQRLATISEGSSYNNNMNNQFGNKNNSINGNKTNNIDTFLSIKDESLLNDNKDNLLENKSNNNNINYTKLSSFHIENKTYNDKNDKIFLGKSNDEDKKNINIQQDSINLTLNNNSIQQSVSSASSNLSDSQQSEIYVVPRINMFNN